MSRRGNPNWVAWRDYQAEVDRLDALSRTRALTDAESVKLERFLSRIHRKGRNQHGCQGQAV